MQLVNWHDDTFFQAFRPFFRWDRGLDPRLGAGRSFDVESDEQGVRVTTILPGYGPEDVDVELEGRVLKVTTRAPGEPGTGESADGDSPARGQTRSLRLAFDVDPEGVEADLSRGVLTVRLPRRAEDRARRIEVRGEAPRLEK